ncbi:hypothetical protein OUY22_07670 [Nonomuraea sp. MCN248]|uniref:Rpn family recombination-promoting nuclease/putative transposase n=1 Tax=Nonomuraea corallina TaxID=2989783 RepID=A0ABT4S8N9_9ACTN|nr:hypothetical protein [Nonomuraea corallina]MDA0633296.1 hypothetical protein [Nonomuraea corallina]
MPSPRHDALIQLVKDRPELAVEILRDLKGVEMPTTPLIRVADSAFNNLPSGDLEADVVVVLGPPDEPAHAIVVEIQHDESKDPRQLARYAVALWLLLRCDVTVLVICPDRGVAAHYATPVDSGLPGYRLHPHVLVLDDIPVITDPREASAQPALSALSVKAHGMKSTAWPVYSPFAREHYGRGFKDGLALVEAEGRVEEAARLVMLVLETRGFTLPDDTRARITACTDLDRLETWIIRAVTAQTLDDLFDEAEDQRKDARTA